MKTTISLLALCLLGYVSARNDSGIDCVENLKLMPSKDSAEALMKYKGSYYMDKYRMSAGQPIYRNDNNSTLCIYTETTTMNLTLGECLPLDFDPYLVPEFYLQPTPDNGTCFGPGIKESFAVIDAKNDSDVGTVNLMTYDPMDIKESLKYTVVEQSLTWAEAMVYCEARGEKLAEPHSKKENEKIKAILNQYKQTGNQFWFGLRKMANDTWQYTDGSAPGFSDWGSVPVQPSGDGNCTSYMTYGSYPWVWNDAACNSKYYFVCEPEEAPKYTLVKQSLTWPEAKTYCEERGNKLAEPHSQEENEKIKAKLYIDTDTYMQFWFGLRKVANDMWQYTDGSAPGFSDWGSGQPSGDGDCASYMPNFNNTLLVWNDAPCNRTFYFVCESECEMCKDVLDGPMKGLYKLKDSMDERCEDGCLYSNKAGRVFCFEDSVGDRVRLECPAYGGGSKPTKPATPPVF